MSENVWLPDDYPKEKGDVPIKIMTEEEIIDWYFREYMEWIKSREKGEKNE